MHELAICNALIGELAGIARRHGARKVLSLRLRIGPLSGVEPDLLSRAFAIASAGTVADGAVITIDTPGARIRCRDCGAETGARPNRLVCAACGSCRTLLQGGDELLLERVELEREEQPGNHTGEVQAYV